MVEEKTLLSAKSWEVFTPPPFNSLKGLTIPRMLHIKKHRRKISVEIYKISSPHLPKKGNAPNKTEQLYYEECIVKVLDPTHGEARRTMFSTGRNRRVDGAQPSDQTADTYADDEGSTFAPSEFQADQQNHSRDEGWIAKYQFPISAVTLHGIHHKTGVYLEIDFGKSKQSREIIFDTKEEAEDFERIVENEKSNESKRSERKLQVSSRSVNLEAGQAQFLIEIVSGWDLPAGDFYTSDPYVICNFRNQEIHRTKYISRTLDPIWTLKTGSLFIFSVEIKALFLSDGIELLVKDFDKIGKNESLGVAKLKPHDIYNGKGDRFEIKLQPPPGDTSTHVPGYIAIRCRPATDYDIKFMNGYKTNSSSMKHDVDPLEFKGGSGNIASYFRRQTRTIKVGNGTELKQYKIRPNPDPKRESETTWMSKIALEEECRRDSQHWIESGSGKLARLFVEIIGCDGLPNLDTGGRNKTDAFIAVVFEDSYVTTDVIDDCLSPRWMPWTKRAFIFHMYHSSSQLFLGVFDYDQSLNPTDDHDLVGRISVDISNLHKDTTYDMRYNIYTTARMSERVKKGSLLVRLRLEIENERKLLIATTRPPPTLYVNVKKRKDFRVVRYTCTGKYDMTKYNLRYINSYIEELLALQHALFYFQDAVESLIFWRGTWPISIAGLKFKFPLHSLSFYCGLVLLVEYPQTLPSLVFGTLAWASLATMDYRRNLPDPWSRCKTYGEFAYTLIFGSSPISSRKIEAYENYKEAQKYLEQWKQRVSESEISAAKAYEDSIKAQEEYEKEMEEIGEANTDISTKSSGISMDPFKPILFPVQQNLAMLCRISRHAQHLFFWEECYIAFWFTTGCFTLAVIFLFVPWYFLLKWGCRLVLYTLFGPWMKLVDKFYISKILPPTEDEIKQKREREREKRRLAMSLAAKEARIKRENTAKLKAMKKYMFGKFITRVPVLKEDRYRDVPLPDSSAMPHAPKPLPLAELAMQESGYHRTRLPSQHLVGEMIPRIETVGFTEAPVGQATARPRLVDKSGVGRILKSSNGSTLEAYATIGSLLFVSALATYFVVPLLFNITDVAVKYVVK